MSQAVSQAEFARLIGVQRSYVTALKKAGRLVTNAIGNVLVEESRQRIAETADLNRDDVVSRFAAERGPVSVSTVNPEKNPKQSYQGKREPGLSKVDHQTREIAAKADMAEMERDRMRGALIERSAIEAAIEDVMTTVRQALEQQPHRVAPMLVGLDLDAIRATLKQENYSVLAEMVKDFNNRIRQMAGEDE